MRCHDFSSNGGNAQSVSLLALSSLSPRLSPPSCRPLGGPSRGPRPSPQAGGAAFTGALAEVCMQCLVGGVNDCYSTSLQRSPVDAAFGHVSLLF